MERILAELHIDISPEKGGLVVILRGRVGWQTVSVDRPPGNSYAVNKYRWLETNAHFGK